MQIYENRNKKSLRRTSKCGYCRKEGHNKYQCPQVAADWVYWQSLKVPPQPTHGWFTPRNPKYWGEWYETCRLIYKEQQARKNNPTTQSPRAASKCGFCGSEEHTRRNCPSMESWLKKAYKANENWRRAAYKELVEKHGICVGACFEVRKKSGWGHDDPIITEVALITKVNFESLNLMAVREGWTNYDGYDCRLEIHALIDGEEQRLKFQSDVRLSTGWESELITLSSRVIRHVGHGYRDWAGSKLLSRSEHPLDEKWVTDYKGAFDLLLRKRSLSQLHSDGVTSIIEKWSKKD